MSKRLKKLWTCSEEKKKRRGFGSKGLGLRRDVKAGGWMPVGAFPYLVWGKWEARPNRKFGSQRAQNMLRSQRQESRR